MTSLCFAEALGVLKTKHFNRKEITRKGYLNRSYLLTALLRDKRILLDEVPLSDPKIFNAVESVIKKHQIDVSDAFQIVTIKRGRFKKFSGESQSLLITADRGLAKAARLEGVKVWECTHEPIP
jgi:predicted nucleic acid-binding protein